MRGAAEASPWPGPALVQRPSSRASQSGLAGDPAAKYRCFSSSMRPVLQGWVVGEWGGGASGPVGCGQSNIGQVCPLPLADCNPPHLPTCLPNQPSELTASPCSLTAPSSRRGRPRPPTARARCSRQHRPASRACTPGSPFASAERTGLRGSGGAAGRDARVFE